MVSYGGVELELHVLLTSVLDGCEWSAPCPGRFNPGDRPPCIHLVGGNECHIELFYVHSVMTLDHLLWPCRAG